MSAAVGLSCIARHVVIVRFHEDSGYFESETSTGTTFNDQKNNFDEALERVNAYQAASKIEFDRVEAAEGYIAWYRRDHRKKLRMPALDE